MGSVPKLSQSIVGNSKDLNSLRFQIGVPFSVFFQALLVDFAIELYSQLRLMAVKVEYVVTHLMLTAKLDAVAKSLSPPVASICRCSVVPVNIDQMLRERH